MTVGLSFCTPCPAGKFAASSVQTTGNQSALITTCTDTPPGRYTVGSGNVEALLCSQNSFNTFNGATTCVSCPANAGTLTSGATQCLCQMGYYALPAANVSDQLSSSCVSCPKGALCPDADAGRTLWSVRSVPGHWRVMTADTLTFVPCPFGSLACPSSNNGRCGLVVLWTLLVPSHV